MTAWFPFSREKKSIFFYNRFFKTGFRFYQTKYNTKKLLIIYKPLAGLNKKINISYKFEIRKLLVFLK